jgi:hypothetical protein
MRRTIVILLFLLSVIFTNAQKITLNGYVKDMEGVYVFENAIPTPDASKLKNTSYNLVHNRLNFRAYPTNDFTVALEMRNRLFSGKLIDQIPGYSEQIAKDEGIIDLSWNLTEQEKWFFNTNIDRIFIDYMKGDWQVRVGRQRINWGINLVWNPNDIFNTFSYLDFDYEERPGSDAVLITYYPNFSSSIDMAYKAADAFSNTAFAAKYRFNYKNYDIQLIAGQAGNDFVFGGGWSGFIGDLSFRSEGSFFTPLPSKKEVSENAFTGTLSLDYTFSNSLYLHTSFLYNSNGTTTKGESFSLLDPTFQLSAKNLSIGKYELFGQASYPVNPLINTGVAAMMNLSDQSMYVGPSVSISLHNNLELYLMSQIMLGETGSEYAATGNIYAFYGRLRWSF